MNNMQEKEEICTVCNREKSASFIGNIIQYLKEVFEMQIAPFYDHEHKSVFEWDPFDYLHWLRNIQDNEEFKGNEQDRMMVKKIADGLFDKIKHDMSLGK